MSKKVMLYGTAFGSLAAAAFFVYYSKQLYLSDNAIGVLLPHLALLITAIMGVIMCVRSINKDSKNTATLSQLILSGLITGTIICLIVTIIHAYVLKAHPSMMAQFMDFMATTKRAQGTKLNIAPEEIEIQITAMKDQYTSVFRFFILQYSFVASISLLSAALVGYLTVKRRA